MMQAKLVPMKTKDVAVLRKELHDINKGICPLLSVPVALDKMTLDQIHKLKSEEPSEQKGTIRNAIEFRANALEGKITNNWKRYFGADESNHPISLPQYLRNLADYLEKGAYQDSEGNFYIHPTEVTPEPTIGKREFSKLSKIYSVKYPNKKILEYPKSGKWTKLLISLKEELHTSLS